MSFCPNVGKMTYVGNMRHICHYAPLCIFGQNGMRVELGGGPDIVSPKPTPQRRCYFSAADLSPLPHATPRKKSRKKSDSGTLVLTSSPYI